MRKHSAVLLGILGAALFLGVLVIAGCGGGGPQPGLTGTYLAQFKQLLPASQKSASLVGAAKCGACHKTDYANWSKTKHSQALVDCEACHGPGSVHAAAPTLTNILRGTDSVNAAVCGQCHSSVADDWSASKHAQIVTDPVNAGSNNCFRCHSSEFRALNVDEPIAQGQTPTQVDTAIVGLPAATLASFTTSTHSTAACANCHDPHQNTANLTSANEQFYLRRATSSSDLTNVSPGSPAASYTTENHICGSCHNNRGGDPSDAGLTKNTSRPATHEGPEFNMLNGQGGAEDVNNPPSVRTATHASAPDQCVQCHMPNSRHTFTVSLDTSCSPCHTAADAAARESSVQTEIQNSLAALHTRLSNWAQKTYNDPTLWDYTSNITSTYPGGLSASKFEAGIPIEVKRARHNYYFVLLDRSLGIHNAPYTRYLLNFSNTGLDNIGISRATLAPGLGRQQVFAILNGDIAKVRAANAQGHGF